MILYHWKKKLIDIQLYNLPSRKSRFFRKSTLYINGFSNRKFESMSLDYAYQLVESVVIHGEYEDNLHLFNSSSVVCYISSKRFFMTTNFIRTNKLRLAQEPFNIPGTAGA